MAENVAQKRRADVMENKENVENMQISSKGRLPAVLAEFDIEVETRCEALRGQARELEASFRNQLILETLKIPRDIRTMPMKTFAEQYGGDLTAIVEEALRKRYEPMATAASTRTQLP
ncbi:uncharacterized protein ACA1_266350 [Acanthamoeba castellanii str. Neff]|uniref:Borealin N-terminal domain-containing protein n=1 Tax=Acanthamoeba castellanii (strain ATCC 30010 / Neff) TaxID=1257118 RepID=L8H1L6_ACACF|nr:uncharacterized protein ACA1_266350 [Acanthamoeba castellanii str. Neff]ELR19409.1 hypothetical protein ACA1_266350 [Acanthamoeba castellanii str. Neff]